MQAVVKIAGSGSARKSRHASGNQAEARRLHWYIAAVVTALAVLIGVGVLFGRALLVPASEQSDAKPKAAAHAPGYYMRRLDDGKSCRVTVFDHDRGEAIEDKITHCEELRAPSSASAPSARPGASAGPSFNMKPGGFSWGGR